MNLDWLAGFFDGEGCVSMSWGSKEYSNRRHWQPRVVCSIVNTDNELLQRIRDFLKLGNVYRMSDTKKHHRKRYVLKIASVDEVLRFTELLLPHAEAKNEALEVLHEATAFLKSRRLGKRGAKWTKEDLQKIRFLEIKLKKIVGNKTRGRKRKYSLPFD